MAIDYDSHPSDLVNVKGGHVSPEVGIKDLRAAIPARCFRSSYFPSFAYLARDIAWVIAFGWLALTYIPLIESTPLRYSTWALYGWAQGLPFTGLWVLGHEAGHASFSRSPLLNEFVGFILHSFLLTPYFSWQSSHRRHHIYANNMELDHNYVPPRRGEYLSSITRKLDEAAEDAPLYILLRIAIQQIFGFPLYLLTNITAPPSSLVPGKKPSEHLLGNSHFAPFGPLFHDSEAGLIIASDLGVLAGFAALAYAGQTLGWGTVALLYIQPYIWLNHWIVAITFLHHTDPNLPKFEHDAWTFVKGAVATVDRDLGFIGRHFFHHIVEYHVIHHLFSRIPHYRPEEATKAVQPLLGDTYHQDRRPFLFCLWESFTQCQWVAPDDTEDPKQRTLWYQKGRLAPPEWFMARKDWCLDMW